jgi:hypothetical protein
VKCTRILRKLLPVLSRSLRNSKHPISHSYAVAFQLPLVILDRSPAFRRFSPKNRLKTGLQHWVIEKLLVVVVSIVGILACGFGLPCQSDWQDSHGGLVAVKTKSGKSGLSGAIVRLEAAMVAQVALPLAVCKVAKVDRVAFP